MFSSVIIDMLINNLSVINLKKVVCIAVFVHVYIFIFLRYFWYSKQTKRRTATDRRTDRPIDKHKTILNTHIGSQYLVN